MLAGSIQHFGHYRYRRGIGHVHRHHHFRKFACSCQLRGGTSNSPAHQFLYCFPSSDRRPYRHSFHALLHRLRPGGLLALRIRPYSLRPLALGGLHRLPGLAIHRFADYCRPFLLGENRCQISSLANRQQGQFDWWIVMAFFIHKKLFKK